VLTSFGAFFAVAKAVAIQSDGKIIAAGYINLESAYAFALARYNPDGSLDNTFGGEGKVTTEVRLGSGSCYAMARSLPPALSMIQEAAGPILSSSATEAMAPSTPILLGLAKS
jgi:uncharacterized delta-60 repeat protein